MKRKRNASPGKKGKFSEDQLRILESFYKAELYDQAGKEVVAKASGLSIKQVRVWVMNRKAKAKKGKEPPPVPVTQNSGRGFSMAQTQMLESFFKAGLSEKQIRTWSMNFKAKLKRQRAKDSGEEYSG